jgi:hypothetical protein
MFLYACFQSSNNRIPPPRSANSRIIPPPPSSNNNSSGNQSFTPTKSGSGDMSGAEDDKVSDSLRRLREMYNLGSTPSKSEDADDDLDLSGTGKANDRNNTVIHTAGGRYSAPENPSSIPNELNLPLQGEILARSNALYVSICI